MDPNIIVHEQSKELFDAIAHIWNHTFYFLNSMALRSAIQLGIPDAIHNHGKPMTLIELANSLSVHPNKIPPLHQLMRLLVHSNFFSSIKIISNKEEEEVAFETTLNSKLLLKDHAFSQASFALLEMDKILIESSYDLSLWFQDQDDKHESPFSMTHGISIYERMPKALEFSKLFNQAMSSDSRLVSGLLLASNEFKGIIDGVELLVDVAGGVGTLSKAIAEAYPNVNCIVFDLSHVVDGLQGNGKNLSYVSGDMFEAIPRAQVVLFKWAFHNWSDDHVIKALERAKEAIPSKDKGGKVLIIEIVLGVPNDNKNHSLSQFLLDIQMLNASSGKERTEQQWKHLFINAGFCDYKIFPILGSRSIIEVYPP